MIPRLFCPGAIDAGATMDLPDGPSHHARDVLRLTVGDEVTLLNGLGGEYRARLSLVTKKQVSAEVLEFNRRESEAPYPITVAQSLAGSDKMDWIVEKSVELGAAAFVPLAASRSVLRLNPERAAKRLDHWCAIAQSACEQCGRNRIPRIEPLSAIDHWLVTMKDRPGLKLMLSPVHATMFSSLPRPDAGTPVTLYLGISDSAFSDNVGPGFDVTLNATTPSSVPEPGSLALLALGIAGIGYGKRKKT
jgi:16S rRNA (uracil1498-N3)-methyltransferase